MIKGDLLRDRDRLRERVRVLEELLIAAEPFLDGDHDALLDDGRWLSEATRAVLSPTADPPGSRDREEP